MKYKNRKDAKRKYKQALLATVATMTIGVSTFGSTTSAFAAEEDNISVISSHTLNDIGIQVEKIIPDQTLRDKFLKTFATKGTMKVGVNGAFQFIKDAQKDIPNFNDTFRSLAMAGTELIPYAGLVISPLIGLLWSENDGVSAQIKEMSNQILTQVDEKFDTEYVNNLKTDFKTLNSNILTLEKSLNTDTNKNAMYYAGNDIYATRGNWANHIQHSFESLIDRASGNHEVASLPLYTKLAVAHITFLKYMHEHAKGPKLKYDEQSLQHFFDKGNLEVITKKYADHIKKVYNQGLQTFYNNIDKLNDLRTKKENLLSTPGDGIGKENELNILNAKIAKLEAKNIFRNMQNFSSSTWDDPTFQALIQGEWKLENNAWTFINKKGEKKTGWLELGVGWYYLNPEKNDLKNSAGDTFKPGEMVTGKVNIGNKTYYFKPGTGEMVTGFFNDGDTKYYFSPGDNMKNYEGTTFNKGEMVTGFVQLINKNGKDYYYFSPINDATNDYQKKKTFKKGEMWTGWLEYSGKWYYMNKGEKTDRDKGIMLHDENIELDNGKGVNKWYKFGEKGVMKE
ncbi:insecticidal delta-endotoxin Cry8Ea1 family protein [Bacillus cereus]|nr:insecticidal delta-endotoxin Cry8Ea1 family protein [Bacillus cereus]